MDDLKKYIIIESYIFNLNNEGMTNAFATYSIESYTPELLLSEVNAAMNYIALDLAKKHGGIAPQIIPIAFTKVLDDSE